MIQSIADHIHENAPAYLVAMFVSGFGVLGAGSWAWYSLNRDIDLLKCKVGIDDNDLCQWTSTLVEDFIKETSVGGSSE